MSIYYGHEVGVFADPGFEKILQDPKQVDHLKELKAKIKFRSLDEIVTDLKSQDESFTYFQTQKVNHR